MRGVRWIYRGVYAQRMLCQSCKSPISIRVGDQACGSETFRSRLLKCSWTASTHGEPKRLAYNSASRNRCTPSSSPQLIEPLDGFCRSLFSNPALEAFADLLQSLLKQPVHLEVVIEQPLYPPPADDLRRIKLISQSQPLEDLGISSPSLRADPPYVALTPEVLDDGVPLHWRARSGYAGDDVRRVGCEYGLAVCGMSANGRDEELDRAVGKGGV